MIDFELESQGENDFISNDKGFYTLKMLDYTENELPSITEDLGFLYNQSLALIATINKGQMLLNKDFGINNISKKGMFNNDNTSQIYTLTVLEELASIMLNFFQNNEEIMNYVQEEYSLIELIPSLRG